MIVCRDNDHDNEQNKSSPESDSYDDKNEDSDSMVSSSSSHNSSLNDIDTGNNTSIDCDNLDESMSISPFPCDPFESYDWEC